MLMQTQALVKYFRPPPQMTIPRMRSVLLALASPLRVALASNLPFSEWGTVISDPRLVAAIVDRVTFNAHIIQTGTNSYRLTSTRNKKGAANT